MARRPRRDMARQLTVNDCKNPNTVVRSFPAKFAYAKGGTLTVTTAGQLPSLNTAGLGVWNHMYGRTYSAVSEAFIFNSAGAWTSTQRLTRVIVVSRDAKGYTDTVALEILDTTRKRDCNGLRARASRVAWNKLVEDWSEWKPMRSMKGRGGSPLFCFHQEDRLSQIVWKACASPSV